jgi:hypothetical protein
MSHADKVEVMDFLINVLKDHEKNLDVLISRAENLIEENDSARQLARNPPNLRISLKDWEEFCERVIESEIVCFDLINSTFFCEAITENKIYRYSEDLPNITLEVKQKENNLILSGLTMSKNIENNYNLFNGRLSIGLELIAKEIINSGGIHKIKYDLDVLYTKNWLSKELSIHRDFILRGNIDI